MLKNEKGAPVTTSLTLVPAAILFSIGFFIASGCGRSAADAERQPTLLRIGFGLAAGTSGISGIQQTARNIALEGLVRVGRDGRPVPLLAEGWEVSQDRLTWRVRLRSTAKFHSGKRVDAGEIQRFLQTQLPQDLGPAFEDVASIRTTTDGAIEFSLHRPSAFLMERLDDLIQEPGSSLSGTGAFYVADQKGGQLELRANAGYYTGRPSLDRIVIKPYTTVRSAWADLLRGQVDMLYDVGVDALDSLQASKDIAVFTFERGYSFMLLLNFRRPYLRDPVLRRQLNQAIDRNEIVRDVLRGHGTPADGVVWPHHWAYTSDLPRFQYEPRLVSAAARRRLTCIFNEPAYERMALVVQRQLQAVGVDLELELVNGEELIKRLRTGDFDAFLSDFIQGPNMVRPYLFWHSGAPFNVGQFSSAQVDAALDAIRHAADDTTYKAGVAAFQRAVVDDPPAVFLAWRQRARAVSTRFLVPDAPGADILTALHFWRPATEERLASRR